nr:hypothetical protein [Tanacetum cinerariifolium]
MYGYSRCSWYGGPFNDGNYHSCTNVSFGDEFVHKRDPISNDETPDFSYPPSQPQTSSFNQFYYYWCGDMLEDGVHCQLCTCIRCRSCLSEGICFICTSSNEKSSINDLNLNSFYDTPNIFTHPPKPQYETYSCELCGNDSDYGYDCPQRFPLESDEFLKSSVEDLEPIPSESNDTSGSDSECDLSSCENNSMSGNPTPSSDYEVDSLSPSHIPYEDSDPLLKETDILLSYFDNSSPEYETFSFDIEEKNSGSTTTHSDYSLSDYEVFYFDDDHIEEKSSGSTTTHSDFSLPEYDSFIFDLSIDPFPPADRSVSHH